MYVMTDEGVAALRALAARMQVVFGGAAAKRAEDNAYDYAKAIRAVLIQETAEITAAQVAAMAAAGERGSE